MQKQQSRKFHEASACHATMSLKTPGRFVIFIVPDVDKALS
jgi:hypothetical protein